MAEPPEFPLLTIKGPVPWKCNIQLARNRLHEVLMNTHPVLQAISMLWDQLYGYNSALFRIRFLFPNGTLL